MFISGGSVPEYDEIELAIEASVATITLDRAEALNAITPHMFGELNDAADRVAGDDTVRFVVLTGAGRAFSAGVDLKALGQRELENGKVGDILDLPARRFTASLAEMGKVTIAKVNGFCFTGALELAMACDLMVVAHEAKLGDTHAKFGLRPTWGLSQRLPALVGMAKAKELSFTARMFSGLDAVAWGLAAAGAPAAELDAVVAALIEDMGTNSSESFVAYKDLYAAAESMGMRAGLAHESDTDYSFTDTAERLADFR
ncbi:MAG: enoyl-CoA hydratase/isomerase family protein [Actinomycetota bacterium]|nr:enoyl-CoA hydratase/isomerase family protein [Actinomycetota bacterium]